MCLSNTIKQNVAQYYMVASWTIEAGFVIYIGYETIYICTCNFIIYFCLPEGE